MHRRSIASALLFATTFAAHAQPAKPGEAHLTRAAHLAALRAWQPAPVPRIDATQLLAVTVDDLPAHGPLPPGVTRDDIAARFLATFRAAGVPPVYGFTNFGGYEATSPGLSVARNWVAAGNQLGNHTADHPDLDEETPAAFESNIAADEPRLAQVAGNTDWHWFRYPFLHEGKTAAARDDVRAWLATHGYRVAEVSLDFEDYLWNEPYARCAAAHNDAAIAELERTYLATANEYVDVTRDLNRKLYGRQIPTVLLLHIGAFDARMLTRLLDLLRSRGYTFATLAAAQDDEVYRRDLHVGDGGGGMLQEIQAIATPVKMLRNTKPSKQLDRVCR